MLADASTNVGFVIIIVIAIGTSVTAPLLLSRRMDREHHRDRLEDYARQDRVAEIAADTARLLKHNTEMVAAGTKETHAQLREIHIAVNSTLTAQMEATRDALEGQLSTMRRLIENPTNVEHDQMTRIEEMIGELVAMLSDRQAP